MSVHTTISICRYFSAVARESIAAENINDLKRNRSIEPRYCFRFDRQYLLGGKVGGYRARLPSIRLS